MTATAPSGAIAELVQTVFKPVAASATQASDETELDAQCDGWRAQYPGAQFVVSTITAMDRSPAGVSWGTTSPAVVSMDGKPVFTGDASSFQAYCASAQLGIGSARGVSPVDGGSADGPHGWASAVFGFGVATDPAFDKTTQGPYVMFSNCTIELSPFAIANSTKAAAWQSVAQQYPLYGCMFGESTAP